MLKELNFGIFDAVIIYCLELVTSANIRGTVLNISEDVVKPGVEISICFKRGLK